MSRKIYSLGSENYELVSNESGNFLCRKNDQHVGWCMINNGSWEKEYIDKVSKYLSVNSVVLDIGANMGTHTVAWAKKAINGLIHSFEPQKTIFEQLCTNVSINDLCNVVVHNVAVGHDEMVVEIDDVVPAVKGFSKDIELSYDNSKCINYGGARLGKGKQEVQMITVDSMNLEKMDLMKVDVEGAEPLVFYGARNTIREHSPVIWYEKRKDRTITDNMIEQMNLDDNILSFNIEDFLEDCGYGNPIALGESDVLYVHPWMIYECQI